MDKLTPARATGEGDMGWLSWIVVGFIAGALAKGVTGVRGAGCIGTILIGIAGGLLGGVIFSAAGGEGINEFSLYSVLVAFVGATLLLFIYGAITGNRDRRSY
ncbi:MAG TPA: GlsB/YeaQ/YmgE family stress response membrane protein [Acidimicrobiia bacterium]|nr:GlsB/YeaQ/YmgE family stress response membrane protein [Acidimicrobiia bacterium]